MTTTQQTTANDYDFPVPTGDIPARPDRLYVPAQLEAAVAAHVPDDVTTTVNTRFRRTVVRVTLDDDDELTALEISWDAFEDEDHYGGDGWLVVMSAVNHSLAAVKTD